MMSADNERTDTIDINYDESEVKISVAEEEYPLHVKANSCNKDLYNAARFQVDEPVIISNNIAETLASRNNRNDSEKDEISEHNSDVDESDGTVKKFEHAISVDEDETNIIDDVTPDEDIKKPNSSFAAKKTVAQGMMDIALITANANQLRYVLEYARETPTYYLNITLIGVSLVLQVAIGVALIFKGRMDIKGRSKDRNAKRINSYVVAGIFLVTIINVFIASFTITGSAPHTPKNI